MFRSVSKLYGHGKPNIGAAMQKALKLERDLSLKRNLFLPVPSPRPQKEAAKGPESFSYEALSSWAPLS